MSKWLDVDRIFRLVARRHESKYCPQDWSAMQALLEKEGLQETLSPSAKLWQVLTKYLSVALLLGLPASTMEFADPLQANQPLSPDITLSPIHPQPSPSISSAKPYSSQNEPRQKSSSLDKPLAASQIRQPSSLSHSDNEDQILAQAPDKYHKLNKAISFASPKPSPGKLSSKPKALDSQTVLTPPSHQEKSLEENPNNSKTKPQAFPEYKPGENPEPTLDLAFQNFQVNQAARLSSQRGLNFLGDLYQEILDSLQQDSLILKC
ncbi:MAG: hypothetical protein AAFU64_16755 [Bacteroidota bacterium]